MRHFIKGKGEKILDVAKHFDVTPRSLRRMLHLASPNQPDRIATAMQERDGP